MAVQIPFHLAKSRVWFVSDGEEYGQDPWKISKYFGVYPLRRQVYYWTTPRVCISGTGRPLTRLPLGRFFPADGGILQSSSCSIPTSESLGTEIPRGNDELEIHNFKSIWFLQVRKPSLGCAETMDAAAPPTPKDGPMGDIASWRWSDHQKYLGPAS